jgi:hypothetical protein
LHYRRAGLGAVISPQTQHGCTAFVYTKVFCIFGASGVHVGTMSFDETEGDASDKGIVFMVQQDEADGPHLHQHREGKKQTTMIISGGMSAWCMQAFFVNLGRSNVIPTAGGDTFGHKDGPKQGATSCRQGEVSWKMWKAGAYGSISLPDGVVAYVRTHEEIKKAFLKLQKIADKINPGWKEQIGYTGEPSAQAAPLDGKRKAASAAFAGASLAASRKKQLGYTGEYSAQAASFDWKEKVAPATFAGASSGASQKGSAVTRAALDQSSRYADLSLEEDTLINDTKGKQGVDTLSETGGTMPPAREGEATIAPVPCWLTPRGALRKRSGGRHLLPHFRAEDQKGGVGRHVHPARPHERRPRLQAGRFLEGNGSDDSTLREIVSAARECFTVGARGRLGSIRLCMSLPLVRDDGVRGGWIIHRSASTGGVSDMSHLCRFPQHYLIKCYGVL